jgi:hypothetical protein
MGYHRKSIAKGMAAGAVAGVAATIAMDQLQKAWSKGAEELKKVIDGHESQPDPQQESSDSATEQVADKVAQITGSEEPSKEQKKQGGQAVHYAFGTLMGVAYGVAAEMWPGTQFGFGTGYGTAVFLGADETAVPTFGLAPSPTKTPPSTHANAWAAHPAYGTVLELTRRLVRRAL